MDPFYKVNNFNVNNSQTLIDVKMLDTNKTILRSNSFKIFKNIHSYIFKV